MAHISQIAPEDAFAAELAEGYVRTQVHPDPAVPYLVYNYAQKATFDKHWTPVTVASRGLIVDKNTGEIIARPFGKFWNDPEVIEGWNDFPREGPVEVFDKLDGSLGILYFLPDGSPAIATRGSMGSDQALHATEVYRARYSDFLAEAALTYLFEIIYPDNRIVLDYDGLDDLVLLGAVDKETGYSVDFERARAGWSGPVAEKYSFSSYVEALAAPIPADREGFIVRFVDTDKRVKIKGEDYIRLHRLVTGVTPRRVWEILASGQTLDSWLASGVPEEFEKWVRETGEAITVEHAQVLDAVQAVHDDIVGSLPDEYTQKDFALEVQKKAPTTHRGMIFALHSGQVERVQEAAWKQVRPESTVAVWAQSEDAN